MTIHELKTWPDFFRDVADGRKKFEIRKDDRDYKVGDLLRLKEYDPQTQTYTGLYVVVYVEYICQLSPFAPGMVGMGIVPDYNYHNWSRNNE